MKQTFTSPISFTARDREFARRMRGAGKEPKAHAGEFGGADNVREAVEAMYL